MSREIKFRAWLNHRRTKIMCKVEQIDFDAKRVFLSDNILLGWYGFDDIELIQYVGLKDRNGVEIFEGDIVKFGKKIAVVKYGYHNCGCCHDVYGFSLIDSDDVTDALSFGYCEVIGNVWENKELLENE